MDINVVRRISVEASLKGGAETEAGLKRISDAQRGVVATSESQEKATLSVERALERHQRALDINYRAGQQFEKAQRDIVRAQQQGLVDAARANDLLSLAADRYRAATGAANDNVAAMSRVQAGVKGVVTSLGAGGASGAVGGLATSIVGLLGPWGRLIASLGIAEVAGRAFYDLISSQSNTAEKTLSEQNRLIGLVAQSYDKATGEAKKFYDQTKDVVELLLKQQIVEQQQRVVEATRKPLAGLVQSDVGGKLNALFPGLVPESMRTNQLREEFEAFAAAASKLQQGFRDGAPDLRAFQDDVAKVAKARPELEAVARALVAAFQAGQVEQQQLDKLIASLQGLQRGGTSLTDRQRSITGAGDFGNSAEEQKLAEAWEKQVQALSRRNAVMEAQARSAGQGVAAQASLRTELVLQDFLWQKSGEDLDKYNELLAKYGDQIARLSSRAGTSALKSAENQLFSNIEFEKATAGFSEIEKHIASILRQTYGDGAWQQMMDGPVAGAMRFNEALRQSHQISNEFVQTFVGGLIRGEDAMKSLTSAATSLISRLSSSTLNRLMGGGGLFGSGNLMSGGGALSMLGAGAAGYASGSPFAGALGGALAGASFGPVGALIGGGAGLLGGLFGKSAARREEEKRAAEAARAEAERVAAEARTLGLRASLIGVDTSTREGSVRASVLQQQKEYADAVAAGNKNLVLLADVHRREMQALNEEWDKRELEQLKARRQTYQDRLFNASNDTSTLDGRLAALDRQHQRDLEAEKAAGNAALADLEAAYLAERNRLIRDANEEQLAEQRRVAEEAVRFLQNVARNVRSFLDQLQTGQNGILNPQSRLQAAQTQFDQRLALALSGNQDALGDITTYADRLLNEARSFFGSSQGYSEIYNAVVNGLMQVENLATTPGGQNIVDAINGTTAAVNANNALTATANALQTTANSISSSISSLTSSMVSLTSSIVAISQTSRDHLQLMKDQLTIVNPVFIGSLQVSNNLLDALNKIVANTFAISVNTAGMVHQLDATGAPSVQSLTGIFEQGGRIGGNLHVDGGTNINAERDEYIINRRSAMRIGYDNLDFMNRSGMVPTRFMGANDNGRIFAGLAGLARTNAAGFNEIVSELRALQAAVFGGARMTSDTIRQQDRPARPGTKDMAA